MIQYVRLETSVTNPLEIHHQLMSLRIVKSAKLLPTTLATELQCSETTPWYWNHPNFGWQRVPPCEAASAMVNVGWKVRLGE